MARLATDGAADSMPASPEAGDPPAPRAAAAAGAPAAPPADDSLRRRLMLWLLVPLLVLAPATAALLYSITMRTAQTSMDHGLRDTALAIAQRLRTEAGEVRLELSPETEAALRTDSVDTIYFAVLDGAGRRLAGDAALASLPLPLAGRAWQQHDSSVDGRPVRLVLLERVCGAPPQSCQVRVAETLHKREQAQRELTLGAGVAMAFTALVLLGAGWTAITLGLRPIEGLSVEIEQRSLENLGPVSALRVPREVRPLVAAIDRLFGRLRQAAGAQRAFIADAAHQLRTPLTALRTESELALLEPHPPELHGTLQRLHDGAARAARLAGQLLALARAEDAAQNHPRLPLDLRELAAGAADDWVPRAMAAAQDLGFELQGARVRARSFLLREALANLLHNAIEHAGAGARITVRTGVERGRAWFEVEDTGPGIPPGERALVVERFRRGSQATAHGSGLGLAIVRDIALNHGGELELGEPAAGSGLRARVWLPAAAAA